MHKPFLRIVAASLVAAWSFSAQAQIDPVKRQLIQLGYNHYVEGQSPLAAYAFYYLNKPEFVMSNWTLRLSVAPVYLDSELGIAHALGDRTDLGIGVAGGGFADSYAEIRRGNFRKTESFTGHGAELSLSLYHRFNPGQLIPLYGVVRGSSHFSTYDEDSHTSPLFEVPKDRSHYSFRTGLRFGGMEPLINAETAMELSLWYEGIFRTSEEGYGFAHDRTLEESSHLLWTRALLAYTFPELQHSFQASVTAGTSFQADRLTAYRLGGNLPMASEFPLSIPGYYYQELSARSFVLGNFMYGLPLEPSHHLGLYASASSGVLDYVDGLDQPGHWHSSLGGGLTYRSRDNAWFVMAGYAYGIDAIRENRRGSHSIGIWIQLDLEKAVAVFLPGFNPEGARGLNHIFRGF